MSDEREDICAVCGRAVYRFGANAYQHLDWDDPDHNVVLAEDTDTAQRDGAIPGLPNHRVDPESGDYVSEPLRHNDGQADGS